MLYPWRNTANDYYQRIRPLRSHPQQQTSISKRVQALGYHQPSERDQLIHLAKESKILSVLDSYSMLIHKYFLKYVCINIEFKSVVLKYEKNLDRISVLVLISVLSKCKNPFYKFCYIFCYTLF